MKGTSSLSDSSSSSPFSGSLADAEDAVKEVDVTAVLAMGAGAGDVVLVEGETASEDTDGVEVNTSLIFLGPLAGPFITVYGAVWD